MTLPWLNYVALHFFPVTSVPRVASTAVSGNSTVTLRVHVTCGRQSGSLINICSKHNFFFFNQIKYEEIGCFRDMSVRRKF